jgi:hypothetical protein
VEEFLANTHKLFMISTLKNALSRLWQTSNANHKLTDLVEIASEDYVQRYLHQSPRYTESLRLQRHEHKMYSQNGEDGIISEIFRRIGTTNKYFVEFGVGDGVENNTAFLLLQSWQGAWIEGNVASAQAIRKTFAKDIAEKHLHLQNTFITAENIESLFANAVVPQEFDLCSIDIDGNDYWVWKAIEHYSPRVVVIEYNSTFPADIEWIKPYNPAWTWDGTTAFSASLKSLERLGAEKGYALVGCDFRGVNAFFVRHDLTGDSFHAPFTAEEHYEAPKYFLRRSAGHPRSYQYSGKG